MQEGETPVPSEMQSPQRMLIGPSSTQQPALNYFMEEKENIRLPMHANMSMPDSNSKLLSIQPRATFDKKVPHKGSNDFSSSHNWNHDQPLNRNEFATPNNHVSRMGVSRAINGLNEWEIRPSPKDIDEFQDLLNISNEGRRDGSYRDRWTEGKVNHAPTTSSQKTASNTFKTAAPVMDEEDWDGLTSQLQLFSTKNEQTSDNLSHAQISQQCDVNDLETLRSKSLINDFTWIEKHFASGLDVHELPERAVESESKTNLTIEDRIQNTSNSKAESGWQHSMSMYVRHIGDDQSQEDFGKSRSANVFWSSDMLGNGTRNAGKLEDSEQESWTKGPFTDDVAVFGTQTSQGWKSIDGEQKAPPANHDPERGGLVKNKTQPNDDRRTMTSSHKPAINWSESKKSIQPWTPITPINFTPRKTELDESSLKYLMAKWAEREEKIKNDSSVHTNSSTARHEEMSASRSSAQCESKSPGLNVASKLDDRSLVTAERSTVGRVQDSVEASGLQRTNLSNLQQSIETSRLSRVGDGSSISHTASMGSEGRQAQEHSYYDRLSNHSKKLPSPTSQMESEAGCQVETAQKVPPFDFSSRASQDRRVIEEQDDYNSEGTPSIIVSHYQQNGSDSSIILPVEESFDSSSTDTPRRNEVELRDKREDDDKDSLADSLVDSDGDVDKDKEEELDTGCVEREGPGKIAAVVVENPMSQVEVSSKSLCFSRQESVKPLSLRNLCQYPILVILRFLHEDTTRFSLSDEFLKETTLQPGQSVKVEVKFHGGDGWKSNEETSLAILSIPFHASSSQPSCSWVTIRVEDTKVNSKGFPPPDLEGASRRAQEPEASHWFVDTVSVELGMIYCQTSDIFTPPAHKGASVVNSSGHDISFLAWVKDRKSPGRSTFGISLETSSKASFRPAGFLLFTVPARQRRTLRVSVDPSTYEGPGEERCKATLYLRQVQTAQLEEVASLFSQSQRACDVLQRFEDRGRYSDVTSVKLRCILGHCRLQIPKSVKEVYLECDDNQRARRSFALRNSGCFPASVCLSISPASTKSVAVEPRKLHLPAGGQEKVTVQFDPEEACQVNVNLHFRIEQDVGVYFNVPVRARARPSLRDAPRSTPPIRRDPASDRKPPADSVPPSGPSSAHRFSLPRQAPGQ
eukprot:747784-Hanusia_phi.AAC.5